MLDDGVGLVVMLLVLDSVSDCEGDPVALAVNERLFVTDGVVDTEEESDMLGVVVMLLVLDCVSDCEGRSQSLRDSS